MSHVWFSASLRFVVVVEGTAEQFARSVVVFQAEDFPEAVRRAIDVGRGMQPRYRGGAGHNVEWRFKEVETRDLLGDRITDGREVYATFEDIPTELAEEATAPASPETSQPTQTGV